MATMTTQQVIDELVHIRAYADPTKTDFLGRGAAFWANVGGDTKLVTAAHIAWPDIGKPRTSDPNSPIWVTDEFRIATVEWEAKGATGEVECVITSHTENSTYDYATINLRAMDSSADLPGGKVFDLHLTTPAPGVEVTAVGFPDSRPTGDAATGTVVEVPPHPDVVVMRVSGTAEPGYSGGPSFLAMTGGDVDDRVVGLMSGQTTKGSDFALFGAASFR